MTSESHDSFLRPAQEVFDTVRDENGKFKRFGDTWSKYFPDGDQTSAKKCSCVCVPGKIPDCSHRGHSSGRQEFRFTPALLELAQLFVCLHASVSVCVSWLQVQLREVGLKTFPNKHSGSN